MGCAMFFVAMINRPELNDRIEVMMALAPATALAQMKSPIRYFAPFATPLQVCLILHKRIIVISFCVLPADRSSFVLYCIKNVSFRFLFFLRQIVLRLLRTRAFLTRDDLMNRLQAAFCREQDRHKSLFCRNMVFALVDDDLRNISPVINI